MQGNINSLLILSNLCEHFYLFARMGSPFFLGSRPQVPLTPRAPQQEAFATVNVPRPGSGAKPAQAMDGKVRRARARRPSEQADGPSPLVSTWGPLGISPLIPCARRAPPPKRDGFGPGSIAFYRTVKQSHFSAQYRPLNALVSTYPRYRRALRTAARPEPPRTGFFGA